MSVVSFGMVRISGVAHAPFAAGVGVARMSGSFYRSATQMTGVKSCAVQQAFSQARRMPSRTFLTVGPAI